MSRRLRALRCVARVAAETEEIAFELLHAPQQTPAVDLELGLARSTRADPRALLAELETTAAQTRQPVAELRELDLYRAFLARRVLGEDVEDERDAIDDVDREQLLEIALLGGRQLVVEDDDVDVERFRDGPQLLRLALADVGGGVGRAPALQLRVHRFRARGVGEQGELLERHLRLFHRRGAVRGAHQQGALAHATEVDLGRSETAALATLVRARRFGHEACPTGRSAGTSMSTSNTWTTGPPSRTVSPRVTSSSPPGTRTST